MATQIIVPNASTFKLTRPLITSNGFSAAQDASVKEILTEADEMLGRKIFSGLEDPASAKQATSKITTGNVYLKPFLELPLGTKMFSRNHQAENQWLQNTLLHNIYQEKPDDAKKSIGEFIEATDGLSPLKYDLGTLLTTNWNALSYNIKTVLSYPNITDYLIAYSYFTRGIRDAQGMYSFIINNASGAKNLVRYGVISAARKFIHEEQHNVPFNSDNDSIIKNIVTAAPSLASSSFLNETKQVVNDYLFNRDELDLINSAKVGTIPANMIPALIKMIQNSPVPIDKDNINFFLPGWISQLGGASQVLDTATTDSTSTDADFDVEFLEDDQAIVQISASNVKCAAQLFYSMVLGEELSVFRLVDYFTHKYLIRGNMEIQDNQLRENLQLYVFSNKFVQGSNGRVVDRTREPERCMFYRGVFAWGNAEVTEDVVVNEEFPTLWKTLMLESAKYIERAQESLNPDSYVSRTNVVQAVEDLQYNLSTNCTGMANVIAPLIYQELDFTIRKILMHPEVLRQVVPSGGTWWRVVEALHLQMKNSRPKSTVIYNKAKLGYDIIKSIADYTVGSFDDNTQFSEFMSSVDSFITTQSILQEALISDLKKGRDGVQPLRDTSDEDAPPAPSDAPATKTGDDWNF